MIGGQMNYNGEAEWEERIRQLEALLAEVTAGTAAVAMTHLHGRVAMLEAKLRAVQGERDRLRAAIDSIITILDAPDGHATWAELWETRENAQELAEEARAGEVSASGSSMRLTREKLTNLIADALSRADALEDGAVDAHHAAKIIAAALGEP